MVNMPLLMDLKFSRYISADELISDLRSKVTMFKQREIKPYEDARIQIKRFYPEEVNPTSLYVLHSNLDVQRQLRDFLLGAQGIDTLTLQGALELEPKGESPFILIPPVVELVEEVVGFFPKREGDASFQHMPTKTNLNILVDGVHRVWLARELGIPFNAIYIAGANPSFPFYAYPNSWDNIRMLEQVPKREEKKRYRVVNSEDQYFLYRDFGILGGKPRQ